MDETGAVQNLLMETFSMNQSGRYVGCFSLLGSCDVMYLCSHLLSGKQL